MGAYNQCPCQNFGTILLPDSSDVRSILFQASIEAIPLSRSADRSHLFQASNDCMTSILSYLTMKNICQLDIAVTNTAARIIWLDSLQITNHRSINE